MKLCDNKGEKIMSKKDKNKFHRRLKAEILKQMEQQPKAIEAPTLRVEKTISNVIKQPSVPKKTDVPITSETMVSSNNTLTLVRTDLKKSALIIGSIIVFIVILYFADLKTGILLKASNEIFRVFHLGT